MLLWKFILKIYWLNVIELRLNLFKDKSALVFLRKAKFKILFMSNICKC